MTVRELLMEIHLSKTVQSISTKMYYVLFSKIQQGRNKHSQWDCSSKKGVLNFLVKILEKYTHKEFLKIPS